MYVYMYICCNVLQPGALIKSNGNETAQNAVPACGTSACVRTAQHDPARASTHAHPPSRLRA